MSRVGSALDNVVIESWHSAVEFELRWLEHFTTKAQARRPGRGLDRGVQPTAAHSSLGMRSPVAYELALQGSDSSWASRSESRRRRRDRADPAN